MKTNICIDNSISVSQTVNPAIQHPAAKNIKIIPGINNSAIKNATPPRNHISDGERFIFLPLIVYIVTATGHSYCAELDIVQIEIVSNSGTIKILICKAVTMFRICVKKFSIIWKKTQPNEPIFHYRLLEI